MFCERKELENESDVEQKLIWPLLTTASPEGLGFASVEIKTKANIKRLKIGKGKDEKLYFPDYVVVLNGVPALVVEAKHPDEDVLEGLREARLYAAELNGSLPSGVNPCARVLASNGLVTVSCPADTDSPDVELRLDDIDMASEPYAHFVALSGRSKCKEVVDKALAKLTSRPLVQAQQCLGGQSVRNEEIGYNEFGSSFALEYRTVFNPETREDRARIVREGYIRSRRREHYVDEIDRIVRTAVATTFPEAQLMEDTADPKEIINALRQGTALQNKVMLLVGARGSGKTTFIDYLCEVKLPIDLLNGTIWCHLNFNEAPQARDLLDVWILEQLVERLKAAYPGVDFLERSNLEKILSVELRDLKIGPLANLKPGTEAYETRMADRLMELTRDKLPFARALSRYLCGESRHLLVVVFDNCDKLERDDQLRAFEAARWLQSQIRCLMILPLRDVTYETYKNQPPLDTAIKDLIFRIDSPPFSSILGKRIGMVLHDLKVKSQTRLPHYSLQGGIRVEISARDIEDYLALISQALNEHDRFVRSLIVGLAGKDIRKAMEIFLEFCRSGHVPTKEYLKLKKVGDHRTLPKSVVARVMLRRNRRYYSGNDSFLKNIFQCVPEDPTPDHFARYAILVWLEARRKEHGPRGAKGFHQASRLISELIPMGHDKDRITEELRYLAQNGCIITEHQRPEILCDDDLIRISPSGYTHLKMAANTDYLAACSEETWMESEQVARKIADRIGKFGPRVHYSRSTTAANAADFVGYLVQRARGMFPNPEVFLAHQVPGIHSLLDEIKRHVDSCVRTLGTEGNASEFEARYQVGIELEGVVTGRQGYGVFVIVKGGAKGLIHVSHLGSITSPDLLKDGSRVTVRVLAVLPESQKLSLGLVRGSKDQR